MLSYIGSRLSQSIIVVILMTIFVFAMARLGGDPIQKMLSEEATEQDRRALAARLHLDRPLYEQYWIWFKSLMRGDLGMSVLDPYPVIDLLKNFAPNTLKLALFATLFGTFTGLPLGVLAGVRRGKAPDVFAGTLSAFGQSAPIFWIGLVLMYFFAIKWHIFPVVGSKGLISAVLPSISLGLYMTAGITRLVRSAMIEAMDSDYVTLARLKGLPEVIVIYKHALKNALIPVVTFAGMYFAILMSGVVVVEVVFAWPGIGLLTFKSALAGDYPVLQGTVVLLTVAVILINLIVDIAYAFLDPRIRYLKA
jgi:peptide/nickel transport system permease protein